MVSAAHPDREASTGASVNLADRIRAGDRAAESEFVRRYEHGVRTLVRRHTRPREPMVDDFVQDVLYQVLLKLRAGELHDAGALPAYLRATIVYATTAEYRRRASHGEAVASEALDGIASGSDPVEQVRTDQLARQLRTFLDALPVARDRALLFRFYIEERSKEEVCAELGIDPDHFRRVVFRARERLRELIERGGTEPPR
jgi:RNA polymerase sigma-70 factor (ECF subfamily)